MAISQGLGSQAPEIDEVPHNCWEAHLRVSCRTGTWHVMCFGLSTDATRFSHLSVKRARQATEHWMQSKALASAIIIHFYLRTKVSTLKELEIGALNTTFPVLTTPNLKLRLNEGHSTFIDCHLLISKNYYLHSYHRIVSLRVGKLSNKWRSQDFAKEGVSMMAPFKTQSDLEEGK